MDPPTFPFFPTTTTTPTTISPAQQPYPESLESSPRSRNVDTWDEPLPPVPGAKLRFMCSYGGHIIPRPHNKSLCYVGGETRMVVVDRHSSLANLSTRLSHTLLNGRPFSLKYQLPSEDLDSLISVSTDEDLDNMIEEYDRTSSAAASPLNPSRLRLFLFVAKPETATSMGNLLDDAKSETWFVDALNGTGLLPRGLSDSAAIDCLLNLDHGVDVVVSNVNESLCIDLEAQVETMAANKKSQSDSQIVEISTSSFGSSSSSPSMSNLPPIRIRVEEGGFGKNNDDHKVGLDEQFAQLDVSSNVQNQDVGIISSPLPPLPTTVIANSDENTNRVISHDERSEQGGAPVGFRKPPLPLQPVQYNAGAATAYNLPSPDSIASDNSLASASSLSTPVYQDPVHVSSRDNRGPVPASPGDSKTETSDLSSRTQMQQVHESGYILHPQLNQQQQQQLVQASTHYIHHPSTGLVQVSPYYSMYAPVPQQQLHHQMDQPIPMYRMSLAQPQAYSLSVQSNVPDTTAAALSRPSTPQNPALANQAAAYKESLPPIYPTKTAPVVAKGENAASAYKAVMTATPPLVQVPSNQFQQQYIGFPQLPNPSQSIAAANYAYEYSHPAYDQVYYTQHPTSTLPSQHQTMTPAAAVYLSEAASSQHPTDNS